MRPIVDKVGFFTEKKLVLLALFSKVTLFSLSEVFCGLPQSSSFEGDD